MHLITVRYLVLLAWLLALPSAVPAELKGYEDDVDDSAPGLLYDIARASGDRTAPPELAGCPGNQFPSNTVFGTGFTSGFAFVGDTLYGLEFDTQGTADVFLYVMDTSFCAQGNRVSESPLGQNLEALATGPDDNTLFTVDFDTAAHVGRLLRVDLRTNQATAVGPPMARDVWIVGLTYDRSTGQLFGIGNGFAARNVQELFVIDTDTGEETLIGATGTAPQEIQGLALDPSTNPARLLATGTTLYEIDRATGAASPVGGSFAGTVYALAEREQASAQTPLPTATPTAPGPTATPSATSTPRDTPTRGPCFGDCNGDGSVSINELIRGVNIALGTADLDSCEAMDSDGDGIVAISELIRAVNAALLGCVG